MAAAIGGAGLDDTSVTSAALRATGAREGVGGLGMDPSESVRIGECREKFPDFS